jgi:hypothetical protein
MRAAKRQKIQQVNLTAETREEGAGKARNGYVCKKRTHGRSSADRSICICQSAIWLGRVNMTNG